MCFGFDLEPFEEIKFQISGKVRFGEVYSVRELKILRRNNYQLPHLKTLNYEFSKSHLPPLAPDLMIKFATHPYTNLVVREYLKQFMWQCLAAGRY